MMNRNVQEDLKQLDSILKQHGLSRRDALKIMGLGGAGVMVGGTTEASAATTLKASDAKGKILIIGGGLSGVATAAKLSNSLSNPDITIIEPNPKSVSYQPGNTLIGAGIWTKDDVTYETKDFLPSGVKWIQDKAVEFNPTANEVKTAKGEVVKYDFLVIAAGLVNDFGMIKGLEEVGEVYTSSADDAVKAKKILGQNGICSVYFTEGAVDTWTQMQKFVADAKSGKKVTGVFAEPHTPFKCGGAQKKITNLVDARLNEAGARANANLEFLTNGKKLFGVPEYHTAIEGQMKARNVNVRYEHKFTEVDLVNKIAKFEKHWEVKGAWDEDLEEFTMETKTEAVDVKYDFCHVIAPSKAPNEIAKSPLGSEKGWVPVNIQTMQHVTFPNVFALGDIAAVPLGKTGGSARKQYAVLCANLISLMEGKEMTAKYEGYTVCPLITSIGTVMLAEFKWKDVAAGTGAVAAPSFPLDPTQERWIYWLLKVYLLKPMTMYGMLPGRA
jgi:sulfide:quinone oxidoreductase